MTRQTIGASLGGVLLLAGGILGAQGPALAPVRLETDLVYATVDGRKLKLDLARPAEGDGPFPALVVIHGGAWRGGDKASNRDQLRHFAARGYVAISPAYRFCPEFTFPAQVHDVKAAVRWLKAHAADYGVDPERIGAIGFSAGAHLALMLGVTDPDDGLDDPAQPDLPDSRVHAVVNVFGPTDLLADDIPPISQPLLRDFLGGSPQEKEELARLGSPLTHVTPDDPPVLTFQGTKDPLVPHTQATKLADALTRAGVPGRVELLVGKGHGNDWGDDLPRIRAEIDAFFDALLKPAAP
ncbi:MAG: lipase [Isosphaeraceae bacterium]|jgi:acetyl esterase/lipase|nr:MAG: lipase [Isosphaeraceae bacterium]